MLRVTDMWLDKIGFVDVDRFEEIKTTAELLLFLNSLDDWMKIPGKVYQGWKRVDTGEEYSDMIDVLAIILDDGGQYFYNKDLGRKAGVRLGNRNRQAP